MTSKTLYEKDFFEWTTETAALLRAGCFQQIDVEAVAEEIESLGKSDRREVISRLRVLIMHLLKWQTQPEEQSRSWASTIRTQRDELELVLTDSPSLRARLQEFIFLAYPPAAGEASEEMRLLKTPFPSMCPFTPMQILDREFWPGGNP